MGVKNHKDRQSNEDMIELLDVSNDNTTYSSLISVKLSDERLKLRFSIEHSDFGHLKRILANRPFEDTGVGKYKYFFILSFQKEKDGLAKISVRVQQLDKHKQFEFLITQKYISNIMWFNSLKDKKQMEAFLES